MHTLVNSVQNTHTRQLSIAKTWVDVGGATLNTQKKKWHIHGFVAMFDDTRTGIEKLPFRVVASKEFCEWIFWISIPPRYTNVIS